MIWFAEQLTVDSSGDGTIKLGSSPDQVLQASALVVFIDGVSKFRVGSGTSGDNFIHFNGSQIIKSRRLLFGDLFTNHISGSGGNMNIKSVNFGIRFR